MAEDLTDYYTDLGVKVRYLHSDIKTIERTDIIKELREGVFDVLIGINLLREGLDIPEVSLVAIFDADKEGFLRSVRSLIQTCGRASRTVNGTVIMYADNKTKSMLYTIKETERRRKIQKKYNEKHGITPISIKKNINNLLERLLESKDKLEFKIAEPKAVYGKEKTSKDIIKDLEKEMRIAAQNLEFEKAARIRDRIKEMERNN